MCSHATVGSAFKTCCPRSFSISVELDGGNAIQAHMRESKVQLLEVILFSYMLYNVETIVFHATPKGSCTVHLNKFDDSRLNSGP